MALSTALYNELIYTIGDCILFTYYICVCRLVARGMPPYRYPDKIGRYYGSPHTDEAHNPVFLSNELDR